MPFVIASPRIGSSRLAAALTRVVPAHFRRHHPAERMVEDADARNVEPAGEPAVGVGSVEPFEFVQHEPDIGDAGSQLLLQDRLFRREALVGRAVRELAQRRRDRPPVREDGPLRGVGVVDPYHDEAVAR